MLSPTRIERHGDTRMLIAWNDGSSYSIPYAELRFLCPCAACVDEHTGIRTLRRETVREDVRPKGVAPVGRYAIQISWSDGHASGMYSFDLLQKACVQAGQKLA